MPKSLAKIASSLKCSAPKKGQRANASHFALRASLQIIYIDPVSPKPYLRLPPVRREVATDDVLDRQP
ncbi:MAG TPA: hypothetical protein VGM07_16535 [Stellaceae bacterium]